MLPLLAILPARSFGEGRSYSEAVRKSRESVVDVATGQLPKADLLWRQRPPKFRVVVAPPDFRTCSQLVS